MNYKKESTWIFYLISILQFSVADKDKEDQQVLGLQNRMSNEEIDRSLADPKRETNILHGPDTSFFITAALEFMNVDTYIITAANRRSNAVYMVDAVTNKKLLADELLKSSYALAAELQHLGCNKSTIVGIISHNRLECPIIILATWLTGAAYTGFNPESPLHELQILNDIVKPSIYFCSEEKICEKIKLAAPPTSKIIIIDSKPLSSENSASYLQYSQLIKSPKKYREVRNNPDDIANIGYSSGTTGLPKGITTTHKNIVFVLQLLEAGLYENNGPMITSVTPICAHISGLITALSAMIRNEIFIVMKKYEERLFLSTIQKYKIKRLALAATMVRFLMKDPMVEEYDLTSLEYIVCGGGPIKAETEEALKNRLVNLRYIQQGYAMGETTFVVTLKDPANPKAGTCGVPVTGVEIKVVDTQTGDILGKNEIGEIHIRGPLVMKGYYGNPEATADAIDEDGWLRSGDIGYYDNVGQLYITDRAKEIMKNGVWQVAPAELEAVLLQHPSILDVGVIGILNEKVGEVPRAYVVKRADAKITENDIIQFMTERVSPEKRLQGGVEFVTAIPKNQTGKILRTALREQWKKHVSTATD